MLPTGRYKISNKHLLLCANLKQMLRYNSSVSINNLFQSIYVTQYKQTLCYFFFTNL